jgi:hypothetical protein
MLVTGKLLPWVSLLCTLLLGMLITFGVQLFIPGAVTLPTSFATGNSVSAKNCVIENGAVNSKNKGTAIIVGKSISASASSAFVTGLYTNKNNNFSSSAGEHPLYHLICHS